MLDQWHLARGGQQYGPYSWQDLQAFARAGNIAGDDLLWNPSTGAWVRADQILGLLEPPLTATVAATAAAAARPKRRGSLWLVLAGLALAALLGGGWLLRQQLLAGNENGPQTSASPTAPVSAQAFWESPALEATIAARDGGDWRSYPDLAEEQAAIAQTLSGFGEAMQQGDLDAAMSHIAAERQAEYRELFAANPQAMPSFGELLASAEISFLSEHDETSAYNRTAEYTLQLNGIPFYIVFLKESGGWVLYDF
jgi:hypothetical protein